MSENEKPVNIPFRAKDDGVGNVVDKIIHKVHHLGETVDESLHKFTELGGALTGMAGAFGFERAIETGKEYLEQVGKLSQLTGTSAQNVAALRDVFGMADISAESLSGTLTAISKKSAMAQEGGSKLLGMAKQWGVNLKDGPEATLVSMSKLVEEHKLGAGQVAQLLRVSGDNLGAMMGLLEDGPKHLQTELEEARKQNKYLNVEALAAFDRYKEASVSIHQAWTRTSAKIVVALAPVLTKLSDHLAGAMEKIGEHAAHFAATLGKAMEFGLSHARMIGKVLLANSVLMRVSGGSMGVVGGLARVAGFGSQVGGGLAGLAGLGGATGPVWSIVTMLLRLAGSATGIGLVVVGVMEVMKHLDGIKRTLAPMLDSVWTSLKGIGGELENLITSSPFQSLIDGVGSFIAFTLDGITKLISTVRVFAHMTAAFFDHPMKFLANGMGAEWSKATLETEQGDMDKRFAPVWAMHDQYARLLRVANVNGYVATDEDRALYRDYRAKYAAAGEDPTNLPVALQRKFGGRAPSREAAGGTQVYQDFRGSRFDINQAFAEGFDPDRIAVAFANELGSLGEHRLQSGFSPLFAVR